MSKIPYRKIRLSKANKDRLVAINNIIAEYQSQDLVLTLRQLYYQLVSRDVIPNQQREYDRLGRLLKEGRMAGIVDWEAIEDRLRTPKRPAHWESPAQILRAAANQYRVDRMRFQPTFMECWVEKDALSGVLSRVTERYGIALQVNRGYSSVTAMHDCFLRLQEAYTAGSEKFIILYLGDHDPSGVDMVRDIHDRVFEFWYGFKYGGTERNGNSAVEICKSYPDGNCSDNDEMDEFDQIFEIVPVALTRAQIRQYSPPPNPAKITDSRAEKYIAEHGTQSWEVDALRPEILNQILEDAIEERLDMRIFEDQMETEKLERKRMEEMIKGLK